MTEFSNLTRFCLFLISGLLTSFIGCKPEIPVEEVSVETSEPGEELPLPAYAPEDWPGWRGPQLDGHALRNGSPVWTDLENVTWKVKVPGRGHASPVIVGNRIYLATADEEKYNQSVLAFDYKSGEQLWEKTVHEGNFPEKQELHSKSTHATPTVACDTERVFAVFFNDKQISVTALDLEGNQLWQTSVGSFVSRFGYGPSPVIYKSYLIVAAEHSAGGYIAAVHRKTGKVAWRIKRGRVDSYSSPTIVNLNGSDQIVLSGNDEVAAYNPTNGEKLWSVPGTSRSTCGTALVWDNYVLVSGGYPEKQTVCIRHDGTPEINWTSKQCFYVPSMMIHDQYVYGVDDKGIAYCWDIPSGEQMWKSRMKGAYSASPVSVGETMFVISEQGTCSILKANPNKLEKVSEKKLGDEAFASPAISGENLFLRVADRSGGTRQEWLYCIKANENN